MKRNIHLQLDDDLYLALKRLKNKSNPTVVFMIRKAIIEYLKNQTTPVGMSLQIVETEDRGIQIPETKSLPKDKNVEVPDGVTPRDIIIARRAKRMGRDYDKLLEPFLNG